MPIRLEVTIDLLRSYGDSGPSDVILGEVMTEELFRDDGYRQSCEATVVSVDERGIILDCTVFYATGGGQPGDTGILETADGQRVEIVDCIKDAEKGDHLHVLAENALGLTAGDTVTASINWERRHHHMRMHSALHLLCAVVEGGVTGGSVGEAKSRLDFDLPDTNLDKEQINADLNRLIQEDHPVGISVISEDELNANPEMVRTMSVQPPRGQGGVRVIEIQDTDLQPCGGTHVKSTGEIGPVRVGKIENKGRHNRRINIHLED